MYAPARPIKPDRPVAGSVLTAVALRLVIVTLALATAAIHSTLGGLLFTANALGYATFAFAMVAPFRLASRYRWLVRLALVGFTLATIAGWWLMGARIPIAYLDKGIEALLVGCLVREIYRDDGGFADVLRRLRLTVGEALLAVRGWRTAGF